MPITSNEIASLLGQQQQQLANSYFYAQNLSANSPFAGLEHRATGMQGQVGGIASSTMGAQGTGMAAGGASMLMGGLGLAASFGAAPRIFDPFTSTMHAAQMGFRGGGGVANLGRATAGAAGAGLGMAGAYLAVGAAANFATKNIIRGAQERAHMQNTIMGNAPMAGMNMQMGFGTASSMTDVTMRLVDRAQASGLGGQLGAGQMANLVGQGMQSGAFRGVSSVNQFERTLNQMASQSVQMASLMQTSVGQGQQTIQALGQMGIQGNQAVGFMRQLGSAMPGTGLGIQQQMGMAQAGSATFRQMGLGGGAGARFGVGLGQRLSLAQESGIISREQMNDMGGVANASARFTNAAVRVFSGRQGMRLLGAMVDEEGNLDTTAAFKIATGQMSKKDIISESKRRQKEFGKDTLLANRQEVMGQFLEQFGPQGALKGAEAMACEKAPEFGTQMMTGLGKRELSALRGLSDNSSGLQLKIRQAAQAGMREGSGGAQSIGGILSKTMDQITGPVKKAFSDFGRSIQKGISGALDDINRGITGQGPRQLASSGAGFNMITAHAAGVGHMAMGTGTIGMGAMGGAGMFGGMTAGMGLPQAIGTGGGLGGYVGGFVPPALRAAAAGQNLGDMQNYGFNFADPAGASALTAYGMMGEGLAGRAGLLGGRGLIGGIGRGMTGLGGAAAARIGAAFPTRGLMGLGGRGMVGGTAMLGARLGQGAGFAARGLGALSRFASGPIGLAVTAGMALPGMMRFGGFGGAQEGIMGADAEAIAALAGTEAGFGGAGLETASMELPGFESYNRGRGAADQLIPVVGFGGNQNVGTLSQIGRAVTGDMADVTQRGVTMRGLSQFVNQDFGIRAVAGADRIGADAMRRQLQGIGEQNADYITGMSQADINAEVMGDDTGANIAARRGQREYDRFVEVLKRENMGEVVKGGSQSVLAAYNVAFKGKGMLNESRQRISRMLGASFVGMGEDEMRKMSNLSIQGVFGAHMKGVRQAEVAARNEKAAAWARQIGLRPANEYISEAGKGALSMMTGVPTEALANVDLGGGAKSFLGGLAPGSGSALDVLGKAGGTVGGTVTAVLGGAEKALGMLGIDAPGLTGGQARKAEFDEGVSEMLGAATSDVMMGMGGDERQRLARADMMSKNMSGSRQILEKVISRMSADGATDNQIAQVRQAFKTNETLGAFARQNMSIINKDIDEEVTKYKHMRADDARLMIKYTATGTTLAEELAASGIPGTGKLAAAYEELDRYRLENAGKDVSAKDYIAGEQQRMAEIRRISGSFDDDESSQLAIIMQSIGDASGSASMFEAAMIHRSIGQKRTTIRGASRKPGSLSGKQKRLGAFFGNSPDVQRAVGLSGSKDHRKFLKEYVKEYGMLPPTEQAALVGKMRRGLIASGMKDEGQAAAAARKHVGAITRMTFDEGGLTDEEMKSSEFIEAATAMDRVAGATSRTSGARGGGPGRMGNTASVDRFSKALDSASERLEKFRVPGTNLDAPKKK